MSNINEVDVSQEWQEYFNKRVSLLKKKFEKRRISVYTAEDSAKVIEFIDEFLLTRNIIKSISFSDSVTNYQLGIFDHIYSNYSNSHKIINPFERTDDGKFASLGVNTPGRMNLPYDEYMALIGKQYDKWRETLLSDLLIIGANAITLNGEIVSIDGVGNRVAGMMFGPKYVICIVGRNKICRDVESALYRIKNVAAPLNYIRHRNKHWGSFGDLPCVKTGKCTDCSHERSACLITGIVRGQNIHNADRFHLVIVNKDLGL